ncbi:hypothetical protein IAR50_001672 [Cryptococcus sp. DSM 104548]
MLWRFNLASTSTLDSLLTREVPPTLEELMDEPDVLTECKGQNNRLVTFLSREDSAKSLLQWVVAGLDELDQAAADADTEIIAQAIASPDLYPAYKAPTPLVIPGAGPGSPPLEPAKLGVVNGDKGKKDGEVEEEEEGHGELDVPGLGQGLRRKSEADDDISRSKYPTTATEILTCQEIWSIADTIIRNADTLLTPFWDAVLPPIEPSTPTSEGFSRREAGERDRVRNEFWSEKDEERDRRREIIRGLWMRVNAALLIKRGPEMIRFIQSLPNIVERLLARISSPAVQSLLITLISREEGSSSATAIDWLADEKLVPRLLRILSPDYPSTQHTIVSDLIKQVITLCAPSPFNPHGGNAEQQAGQGQAGGRDNRLIRELVSEENVDTMIGYMLDDIELSDAEWKGKNGQDADVSACDPFIVHPLPSIASATSSLIELSSILIEIIRRNNSDFSEPHLFHTLRNRLISARMQEVAEERENGVAVGVGEGSESTEAEQEEKERKHMEDAMVDMSSKMGIVHLGHLLNVISERFEKLQALVLQPRSQGRAASVSNSKPFTLERFRIIELYAELLHSSNMSILNRLPGTGPVYSGEGILSGGLEGLEALGEAIEDNDNDGAADMSRGEDDLVTQAKELPVSDSTGGSLTGSDNVESEDEDVLEAVNTSLGPSSVSETPLTFDAQPPPPTVEVAERLRDVMEAESEQGPSSSAASEVASAVSRMAEATSTAAPSIASEPPEMREDSAPTPHVSTHPLPSDTPLAPGDKLKRQYLTHRVMPAIVDLFFDYPENDFMHHVVYDIFQQVLNGKLGPGLNRDLIVQLMGEGRLVERVLDAQRVNDELVKRPRGARLPYMGHLVLIAEEIVKFFARCPSDLFALVEDTFVHTEWEAFVNTSLREAKAKDERPLAGGKPEPPPAQAKDDSASEEDDDDEPEEGSGGLRFGEPLTRTRAKGDFAPRGEFDAYSDHDENGDGEDDEETMDRYWKNSGLGLARRGVADSSDEDDDDADWLQPPGGNSWSASGDDDDFGAWETGEVAHPGTGNDFDDDAWGNFTSSSGGDSAENPFGDDFGDDNFAPSVVRAEPQQHRGEPLTPLDWAEQFDRAFREGGGDDTPPGSSSKQAAYDQGGAPEQEVAKEVVPIVMPSLDDDEGDDDVALAMSKSMEMSVSAGSSWTFAGGDDAGVDLPPADSPVIPDISRSPISPARERSSSIASSSSDSSASTASTAATATPGPAPIPIPKRRGSKSHSRNASLSRSFGGHRPHPGHPVTSPSSSPSSSQSSLSSPTSPSRVHRWGEAFSPPDPALIAAATQDSPLGPGVSSDTKITEDGLLEREVDGKQVRVPQDEIVEAIERNADEQETTPP